MNRPIVISRVRATGRVPFDLNPVTAAMAVKSTASPSQTSQSMNRSSHGRSWRGPHSAGTRRAGTRAVPVVAGERVRTANCIEDAIEEVL